MGHPIATFPRFMYLNFWAFFLLLCAVGLALAPVWRLGAVAVAVQVVVVLALAKGSLNIFNTWGDKKRKYAVLVVRNGNGIRPETFGEYLDAPCGRLLVRIVLRDLGEERRYREIRKTRKGFWRLDRNACRGQRVVVRVNPNYKPPGGRGN